MTSVDVLVIGSVGVAVFFALVALVGWFVYRVRREAFAELGYTWDQAMQRRDELARYRAGGCRCDWCRGANGA